MKKPFVFTPNGILGWGSYYQIMPQLEEVWRQLPAEIHPLWFPRPKIEKEWVKELKSSASALIFPLGVSHYDSLWTLRQLRRVWGLEIPAVIMVASDMTKGARLLYDYRDTLQECDHFTVNSTAEKNLIKMALGDAAKVDVIPLPVDTKTFRPAPRSQRMEFKSKLGIPSTDPLVVYSGRISLQKNIHHLLELFTLVRMQHHGARLIIAGTYDDLGSPHLPEARRPRYMHLLNSYITKLDLENVVRFTRPLDQKALALLLSCCDLHVSLTVHSGEDFGYSIAQGMACGAPTVVSAWGGGHDFINGGAQRAPIKISAEGPRVDLKKTLDAIATLLNPSQNLQARQISRTYSQNHLSIPAVLEKWRQKLKPLNYGPSPLRIRPGPFLTHYKKSKQSSFFSTRDPLFQKICRVYAGTSG